jgi:hypothetical protein
MVFSVKKVKTPADKQQFIQMPWRVYDKPSLWVPPLISERLKFLNPEVNPFFKESEVDLFLVISESKEVVGRIALIINHAHNQKFSEKVGFFGMFETINNKEASDSLFDVATVWCREKNLNKLVGPVNLSTNHECGLLIDGFDYPPVIGIPYNPSYYSDILDDLKFNKAKDLISLRLEITQMPQYLELAMSRLNSRQRFSVRFIRLNRFDEEIDLIWDIYNDAWIDNWGFVPMSKEEFKYAACEMKNFIQPEYCFISEVNGEPAGFSITLPDINRILKTMNGRLFPLGWANFLWNKNNIKVYRVVALGVKKKYRCLGIDAALYYETYNRFLNNKIKWCDISWVLEDNKSMLDPVMRLGGTIYKRHRIYEKHLLS